MGQIYKYIAVAAVGIVVFIGNACQNKNNGNSVNPADRFTAAAVGDTVESATIRIQSIELDYLDINNDEIATVVVSQNVGLVDITNLSMGLPFLLNAADIAPFDSVRIVAARLIVAVPQEHVVRVTQGICDWAEGDSIVEIPIIIPQGTPAIDLDAGQSYLLQANFAALDLIISGDIPVASKADTEEFQQMFGTSQTLTYSTAKDHDDRDDYRHRHRHSHKKCYKDKKHYKHKYKWALKKIKKLKKRLAEHKCDDDDDTCEEQIQCIKECKANQYKTSNSLSASWSNDDHDDDDDDRVDCKEKCKDACDGGGEPPNPLTCSFTPQLTLIDFAESGSVCPPPDSQF